MALKTDHRFSPRDLLNEFVFNGTAVEGTIMTRDGSDTSPIGQGDTSYGRVTNGSVSVAGDAEIGILMYPVTASGVTYFDQTTGNLNYSTAQNTPCSIWQPPARTIFSTSEFLASGTGAITAGAGSGNTAIDTQLGVKNGQFVIASSFSATNPGSVVRAKLIGNAVINGTQAIRVQIL